MNLERKAVEDELRATIERRVALSQQLQQLQQQQNQVVNEIVRLEGGERSLRSMLIKFDPVPTENNAAQEIKRLEPVK